LQVDTAKREVLIGGVSLVKRHTRPNPQKQSRGGIASAKSDRNFERDGR
jgi:ribosomal protein L24